MQRIIDKQTNIFIRDDFEFNPETEIGLDVEPSQGLYAPKWNGEAWEESLSLAEIEVIKAQATPQEPTLEERVTATETNLVTIQEAIDVIFGGV